MPGSRGGANDYGTVFEIAKTDIGYASAPTTLGNFNSYSGSPISGLVADANGNLFGTTVNGRSSGYGTVFEIVKTSPSTGAEHLGQTITLILSFSEAMRVSGGTLGYAANEDNSGGLLTVSDGTHSSVITLLGQYAAADFRTWSDFHGGTLVTDPGLTGAAATTFLASPHT